MVSEKEIKIPDVEKAQSLESFCRSYIEYRSSLQEEAERLEIEANKKLERLNAEKEKAKSLPDRVKHVREEMEQTQKELNLLKSELAGVQDFAAGTESVDWEEVKACRQLRADYDQRLKELDEERRRREEMREQSSEFMRTLERNQAIARRVQEYHVQAENNVSVIYRCFPSHENEISGWIHQPVEEVLYDFEDYLPSGRTMEDAVVYEPIRMLQMADYLIAPDSFAYRFQGTAELTGIRILIILILLIGVIGAFLVTPFTILAAVFLAMLPCILVKKRNQSYIRAQIPWEELKIYRFILNYSAEEAESLARRLYNLPHQSSKEYEEEHTLRMKRLRQKEQELCTRIPDFQNTFEKGRKEYEKLTAELTAAQEKAGKTNSRLGHAIQKQQNHLELTDNETLLLKNYWNELNGLRSRMEEQKQQTGQAALRLKQTKEELQRLTAEIQETEQEFSQRHKKLEQIEAVLASEDTEQYISDERRRLEAERDDKLERMRQEYAARRALRTEEAQKSREAEQERLNRKIAEKEKEWKEQQEKLQTLELDNIRIKQRLAQLQKEAQETEQNARTKKRSADALSTARVWQENSQIWVNASRHLFDEPTKEYVIKEYAYIMGPNGPYILNHGLAPCVLLYDKNEEDAENRPPYYLEKTIKALMFGLKRNNGPGLTEFAVVDESGNGGEVGKSVGQCYGSQNLKQLNEYVNRQKEKIRQNERGNTINECNQGIAEYFEKNKLVSPEEIHKNLYSTLFVFILPGLKAQERPLNNQELWQKLREDCGKDGFVPLFLIPRKDWEEALIGSGSGSAFASAVKEELNKLSHVRKIDIPLN